MSHLSELLAEASMRDRAASMRRDAVAMEREADETQASRRRVFLDEWTRNVVPLPPLDPRQLSPSWMAPTTAPVRAPVPAWMLDDAKEGE